MAKRPERRIFFRQWRKYRGLTQEAAADRIGVSQETLSRYERGLIEYNRGALEAMADAYNCTPADLLMRDPTQPAALWSIWDNIPPENREQAVRVLEAFTKKTGTAG